VPDISTALALLRKPIEAISEVAIGRAKEYVSKLRSASALKTLYGKLNATQKVKTIWNVDRPIAIGSFYYPARIESKHGSQQLSSLDELPSNHVVLSGIVGQGKSILLRYLLGKEIRSGARVPLFIELRRVLPGRELESFIVSFFNDLLETVGDREIFPLFANHGRISLLLDGFDEVDPSRAHEFASAIDLIALKYPNVRIVVTSRPNSGIENSPLFDVVPLAPLTTSDLPGFFSKILSKDRDLAARLTAATSHSIAVAQMASTPLLATLLSIVYRAHQKIPTDFPEFYDEVFQILLVRHDRAKNGYERKRRTKLSDREIQLVFEAFCYKTRAESTSSVDDARAVELAQLSAHAQQLECDPDSFLKDIVKITCLLQEEGGRVEFLHQSVQEFFAAKYIASRPEEVAQRFYALALHETNWQQWEQVIKFLAEVDKYRSSKHFFVPVLTSALGKLNAVLANPAPQYFRDAVASKIGVRQTVIKLEGSQAQTAKYFIHQAVSQPIYRLEAVHHRIFRNFFSSTSRLAGKWSALFDRTSDGQFISYLQIAEKCGGLQELDTALTEAVNAIRAELAQHNERVLRFNQSSDFMGL